MIQLKTKKSYNNWVEMGEGIKFKVDYPTDKQEQKLQDIMLDTDNLDKFKNLIKYQQYYVKYTVKDWSGFDIPCKIVNDELEDGLWWLLVKDTLQAIKIYTVIQKELEFTEADKKK